MCTYVCKCICINRRQLPEPTAERVSLCTFKSQHDTARVACARDVCETTTLESERVLEPKRKKQHSHFCLEHIAASAWQSKRKWNSVSINCIWSLASPALALYQASTSSVVANALTTRRMLTPTNDSFLKLFGDTVLWHAQSERKASPSDVLADRTILVFFSAR